LFKLTSDEKSFVAYTTGKEIVRQRPVTSVNVIPVADTGDLVLAKIWIDQERSLVLRSQLTTRANGTVLIDYEFGSLSEYALPDRTTFTIEVKKFKIPRAVSADINAKSKTVPPGKEPKTGQIVISFSNYVVNKGLADSVFAP
jgi:outer membrane lipoprotein-sorting protein